MITDAPDVTVRDTRAMPWEGTDWVLPRALARILSYDEDGDGVVYQRFLTAWTPDGALNSSGFRLAHEFYFCLGGEFSHFERDPDGGPDQLVVFRRGIWMDRRPGSLTSGIVDVPVGVKGLGWMIAAEDPYVGLLESQGLTESLPLNARPAASTAPSRSAATSRTKARDRRPDPADGTILKTPFTTVLDSRDMAWEDHPLLPGARMKVLSRRRDGDPTVMLCGIPAGPFPLAELPWRGRHRFRQFIYVLEGELHLRHYASDADHDGEPVVLREGFWVDRRPGSIYGFDAGDCSPSGCTLLTFGVRDGVALVKEADKYRVYTRTLNPGTRSLSPAGTPEELAQLRRDRREMAG